MSEFICSSNRISLLRKSFQKSDEYPSHIFTNSKNPKENFNQETTEKFFISETPNSNVKIIKKIKN